MGKVETNKKYDVILADPPWKYEGYMPHKPGETRVAESYYPTMGIVELMNLPIEKFAADNCALFLWATWPKIFAAEQVIGAWGFQYKTAAFVWVKANKSGFGFFHGMGYYTRANTEPCLLATKGSILAENHGVTQIIYAAVREHSKKPVDIYRKIKLLYPGRQYLELFARRKQVGWDTWGNEVPNSINLK